MIYHDKHGDNPYHDPEGTNRRAKEGRAYPWGPIYNPYSSKYGKLAGNQPGYTNMPQAGQGMLWGNYGGPEKAPTRGKTAPPPTSGGYPQNLAPASEAVTNSHEGIPMPSDYGRKRPGKSY